uniref:Uncharacterized protein n=1 Tax=Arundo donax TaxID=35708 RepID=A0A0A9FV15_ARUDO
MAPRGSGSSEKNLLGSPFESDVC